MLHSCRQSLSSIVVLSVTLTCLCATSSADVSLPGFFTDHMVVQQKMKVQVWGWANANEKVSVSFSGNEASTTAGPDGEMERGIAGS